MIVGNETSHRLSRLMKIALVLLALMIAPPSLLDSQDARSDQTVAAQDTALSDAASQLNAEAVSALPFVRSGPEPPLAVAPFDAEHAKLHQQAWSAHRGLPVEWTNSLGMKMVLIPPGQFVMGNSREEIAWARTTWPGQVERGVHDPTGRFWLEDALPPHRVRITQPFYLSIHEVTQDAYESVMGVNPSLCQEPRHPVETVSWHEAVDFCHRLSALPEETSAGRVYRLPTEAEWEFACRAGTTTPYHFGDDPSTLEEYAWYGGGWFLAGAGAGMSVVPPVTTHPVGQKRPNAWGLFDMLGNVQEWCHDVFSPEYYRESPVDDPAGPVVGSSRVTRGGAWPFGASSCRSASRFCFPADRGVHVIGFRVAMVPPSRPSPGQK